MKILYVGRSCQIGGVPNVRLRAAHGLMPKGHEIHLLSQNGPMAGEFKKAGVRFHATGPTPFNRLHLAALLKRERFDIIHADNTTAGDDVLTAMKWAGLKGSKRPAFVIAVHGLLPSRATCSPCLMNCDCVIVFDASTITHLRGFEGMADQPLKMVRRPVQAFALPILSDTPPHFTFVSRLSKSKSQAAAAAIGAVEELEADYHGLGLTIIGEGSQRGELQKLADALNTRLKRRAVILTGALTDPFPLMSQATGVIGTAMVAMEALFHKIPVVAAGYQGFGAVSLKNLDEAIECNFGDATLKPYPVTKDLLLKGMRQVLAERNSPAQKAEQHAISQRLRQEHSEEAVASGLEKIYQETIAARGAL